MSSRHLFGAAFKLARRFFDVAARLYRQGQCVLRGIRAQSNHHPVLPLCLLSIAIADVVLSRIQTRRVLASRQQPQR